MFVGEAVLTLSTKHHGPVSIFPDILPAAAAPACPSSPSPQASIQILVS